MAQHTGSRFGLDGRGEVRRLEKSRILYVTADSSRPAETSVRTCSF